MWTKSTNTFLLRRLSPGNPTLTPNTFLRSFMLGFKLVLQKFLIIINYTAYIINVKKTSL